MMLHEEHSVNGHHRHAHHVRGSSTNGFSSFGGMFGLPSMPEGGESENGGVDDVGEEGDHELDFHRLNGIDEDMEGVEEESRGRTRVKGLGSGHGGKIKEEQDIISMEA